MSYEIGSNYLHSSSRPLTPLFPNCLATQKTPSSYSSLIYNLEINAFDAFLNRALSVQEFALFFLPRTVGVRLGNSVLATHEHTQEFYIVYDHFYQHDLGGESKDVCPDLL